MAHLCPLSITCQVYRSLWCHGHCIYTNTAIVNKVNYRVEPSKQYCILALHGSIMSRQFVYWAIQQLYVICHINLRIEHYSNTTVQSQKVVSAHFTSKQILFFGFAEQNTVCGVLGGRCFDLVPDLWNLIPIQVISWICVYRLHSSWIELTLRIRVWFLAEGRYAASRSTTVRCS